MLNAPGNALNIFPIIGKKFPIRKVAVVLAKASNEGLISSPKANFPSTFENEAFIESSDPLNVSADSLAVVPVIPISS